MGTTIPKSARKYVASERFFKRPLKDMILLYSVTWC